jgi:hypothetical protein
LALPAVQLAAVPQLSSAPRPLQVSLPAREFAREASSKLAAMANEAPCRVREAARVRGRLGKVCGLFVFMVFTRYGWVLVTRLWLMDEI